MPSDSVFTEAISTSMFVKLGEQKYFRDGAILVRKASSISGDTATWSDQIVAISQQDYQDTEIDRIRTPTGRTRATSATTSSAATRCRIRP